MVILLTMNNRIKWLSVVLRKLIRSKQMILLSEYTHTHPRLRINGHRPGMIRPRSLSQWIINLMGVGTTQSTNKMRKATAS
jgi:hypothetical protein